jgi:hypothetical protein
MYGKRGFVQYHCALTAEARLGMQLAGSAGRADRSSFPCSNALTRRPGTVGFIEGYTQRSICRLVIPVCFISTP